MGMRSRMRTAEIAFRDLAVVEVEEQTEARASHLFDDAGCFGVVRRKYPGMSRALIASMTTQRPSAAARSAAKRRLAT